jgi:hypothetical protein
MSAQSVRRVRAAEVLSYDDAALANAVAGVVVEEVSSDEQDLSE